mmetsp:Transcript_27494/g.80236  ORF Transcript_27494/g.80236 Transcript_27494/m.80236 type:complete len:652 (+) Transcript_27494:2909-4864(+)
MHAPAAPASHVLPHVPRLPPQGGHRRLHRTHGGGGGGTTTPRPSWLANLMTPRRRNSKQRPNKNFGREVPRRGSGSDLRRGGGQEGGEQRRRSGSKLSTRAPSSPSSSKPASPASAGGLGAGVRGQRTASGSSTNGAESPRPKTRAYSDGSTGRRARPPSASPKSRRVTSKLDSPRPHDHAHPRHHPPGSPIEAARGQGAVAEGANGLVTSPLSAAKRKSAPATSGSTSPPAPQNQSTLPATLGESPASPTTAPVGGTTKKGGTHRDTAAQGSAQSPPESKAPPTQPAGGATPRVRSKTTGALGSGSPKDKARASRKPTAESKYIRPHLRIGDPLKDQYEIVNRLSAGSFGVVIGCRDLKMDRVVAIKVQDRDEPKYYKDFKIEIDILQVVCKKNPRRPASIVEMYDFFKHQGRWCIVFEPLGPSLYEFQKTHQYRAYPLSSTREIMRQTIEALAYLHALEMVHTDIKPENICLVSGDSKRPGAPRSNRVKLIDFGTAEWCAHDGHRSALVSTRQYRAPEVVLGLKWNHVIDMWAIGCVTIEMLAGRQLFPTHADPEHLAMMERVSGIIPPHMSRNAADDLASAFDDRSRVRMGLVQPERRDRVNRLILLPNMFPDERDGNLLKLLMYLLTINPRVRIPAKHALQHPFFKE